MTHQRRLPHPITPEGEYLAAVVGVLDEMRELLVQIRDRLGQPVAATTVVDSGPVQVREPAPVEATTHEGGTGDDGGEAGPVLVTEPAPPPEPEPARPPKPSVKKTAAKKTTAKKPAK